MDTAATVIWQYWNQRFKHNTTKSLIIDILNYKFTIKDTEEMNTQDLKILITSVKPVSAFIRLIQRLCAISRTIGFAYIPPPTYKPRNEWIFVRAFLFYHNRIDVQNYTSLCKRALKDMVDVSRRLLHCFFDIVSQFETTICDVDINLKQTLPQILTEYVERFYAWNNEITKEHFRTEHVLLGQDRICLSEVTMLRQHSTNIRQLHVLLNGPKPPHTLQITQSEYIRQLLLVAPTPEIGILNAAVLWRTFKRSIKETHIFLGRIHRLDMDSVPEDPIPNGCNWVAMDNKTLDIPIMSGFMALALVENIKFEFKAVEHTIQPISPVTVSSIGQQFPVLRNSKIIFLIRHGYHSMAIVKTPFAPHIVITQGSTSCTVRLTPMRDTICVTAEPKNPCRIGVAIIEIKICAACGKPAKLKCAGCWTVARICVRYCCKKCQTEHLAQHRAVCGRV